MGYRTSQTPREVNTKYTLKMFDGREEFEVTLISTVWQRRASGLIGSNLISLRTIKATPPPLVARSCLITLQL